jgi:hypothetical protein
LATEASEDITSAQGVELLSRVFDVSKSLAGSAPGIGSFLDYYSKAIKIAARGVKKIEDTLFEREASILVLERCGCLAEEPLALGYHGEIREVVKRLKMEGK